MRNQASSLDQSGANESHVIKPATLKYVAPQHISNEKGQPLTFHNKDDPNSPKLERKSSIGSEGSCFSKPNMSNERLQHTIGDQKVQVNFIIN